MDDIYHALAPTGADVGSRGVLVGTSEVNLDLSNLPASNWILLSTDGDAGAWVHYIEAATGTVDTFSDPVASAAESAARCFLAGRDFLMRRPAGDVLRLKTNTGSVTVVAQAVDVLRAR